MDKNLYSLFFGNSCFMDEHSSAVSLENWIVQREQSPSLFGAFTPAKLVAFGYENEVDLKTGNTVFFFNFYFIFIFDELSCHFIEITEADKFQFASYFVTFEWLWRCTFSTRPSFCISLLIPKLKKRTDTEIISPC